MFSMVVDYLTKEDRFLIIWSVLSEKSHSELNIHHFFMKFFDAINGEGYPLRSTFLLTHNLREKIPYEYYDDYQNLFNYCTEYKRTLVEPEIFDCEVGFVIGELIGEYYKIDNKVLDIEFNLYFSKDLNITIKYFVAESNISIFRYLNEILEKETDIYIGGDERNSLPLEQFERLIKNFPNTREIWHYRRQRVAILLREYFDITYDFEKKYYKYLLKKQNNITCKVEKENYELIAKNEAEKYQYLYDNFQRHLDNSSVQERDWQNYIYKNNIFKFLFPKYVHIIKEPKIIKIDPKSHKVVDKKPDFICVDADGYIDIIELKNSSKDILRSVRYRNNYVPSRELSSSIIQIEQYIFHLSNNSLENQKFLNKEYAEQLEHLGIKVKIVNPKGLLVIGRECKNDPSRDDFEIIKRHYRNVVDIITYDDLLRRLKTFNNSFTSLRISS